MLKAIRLTTILTIIAIAVSACGEDTTAPTEEEWEWGAQEQQALLNALNSSGVLTASPIAGYAAMVVGTLSDVGTIAAHQTATMSQSIESGIQLALTSAMSNTYDGAVGVQVGFDIDGTLGWFVGVIGWNGLTEVSTNVSQLVGVYHFDTGSNEPPATHNATIGLDGLEQSPPRTDADHHLSTASYWDGSNTFWGTSGSFDLSASSFSGTNSCSQVSFSCSYSTGTISGAFNFEALTMMGDMSFTQVPVSFSSIPAVKLIISPDL